MASLDKEDHLTAKQKLGYGAGDCGGTITLILIGSYLTRYVTNVLGISYGVLSALLLIWNIWDMINDPIVGALMDKAFEKTDHHKDKFRPWILWSIPLIVLGYIAFFNVPGMLKGMWAVIALFLLKIVYEWGYTMMNIAMGSLLGAMATNDTERASLSSARGMGSTVGILLASATIPQILKYMGETKMGYAVCGIFSAILGGVLIYIHYAWTEERNPLAKAESSDEEGNSAKLTDILGVFKNNRAYLALCLHSIIIVFGTTVCGQALPYILADVYHNIGLQSLNSIVSQGLTLIILAVIPKIVEQLGGTVSVIKKGLLIGALINIALYIWSMVGQVPAVTYLLIAAVALALINLSVQMQWGLVSESIDYNEYLTGKRTEGAIYGVFSFTRRLGQTIAQSLAVLMIGWIGYDPALTNAGLEQSAATVNGLQIMNLVIPALAALGSYLCFKYIWNIDDNLRAKMAAWKTAQLEENEK